MPDGQDQDFIPDANQDFIPDKPASSGSFLSKGANWLLNSLLPESETGHTDTFVGANIPGLNKIYPGGIQVPNLRHLYEEVVRPTVSPIGLATLGMGAYGMKRAPKPGLTGDLELPPEPPVTALERTPKFRGRPSSYINRGFYSGSAGTAENRPYVIDVGEQLPAKIAEATAKEPATAATILPREAEGLSQVPPQIAAEYGIQLGRTMPSGVLPEDKFTGYSPVKQLRSGTDFVAGEQGVNPTEPLDSRLPRPEAEKFESPESGQAFMRRYTNVPETQQLNATPEQGQLPAGSGFTSMPGGEVLPTTKDILDVGGGPQPELPPTEPPARKFLPVKDITNEPVFDAQATINQIIAEIKGKTTVAPEEQPFIPESVIEPTIGPERQLGPAEPTGKYSVTGATSEPQYSSKLEEFFKSEEGALKPEVISEVKDKIIKSLRTSRRISVTDMYNQVAGLVSKKQFDKIVDEVIESGAANYKAPQKEQVPINASTDYVRNPTDAISKLTEAIRQAGPQREMQEQLYTQERGKRIGEAQRVKTGGLEGIYERFGKLKGELPKVDYEGLRLNRIDVDNLADAITNSQKITEWEKMNAREGMLKILTGSGVPQRSELALLSQVFGQEFSDVVFMHGGLLGPVPFKAIADINNLSKTFMSSYDASFPLRQGGGLIHEGAWWKSFGNMWKLAGDEVAYKSTMDAVEGRPKYLLGREAGLQTTSLNNIMTREESFLSKQAEKIPGIRASERMAVGFVNKLRADVFDRWTEMAEKAGLEITDEDGNPTKITKDIAKVINNSTGRGSLNLREIAGLQPKTGSHWNLEKIAPELNQIFYSPRFIASRLTMLNPNYYVQLEPFARKQAIKSLLAIAGTDVLTSKTLALGAGATVGGNLLSSDWMRAKIDNTRMGSSAALQNYIVAAYRFARGETDSPIKTGPLAPTRTSIAMNFLANKTSPAMNLAYTLASGQPTKEGGLKRYGREINIPIEVAQKFIPMFMQDIYELYQDDPNLFPLGEQHFNGKLAGIPLSALGGEVNTYNTNANKPVRKFRLK